MNVDFVFNVYPLAIVLISILSFIFFYRIPFLIKVIERYIRATRKKENEFNRFRDIMVSALSLFIAAVFISPFVCILLFGIAFYQSGDLVVVSDTNQKVLFVGNSGWFNAVTNNAEGIDFNRDERQEVKLEDGSVFTVSVYLQSEIDFVKVKNYLVKNDKNAKSLEFINKEITDSLKKIIDQKKPTADNIVNIKEGIEYVWEKELNQRLKDTGIKFSLRRIKVYRSYQ